MIGQHKMEQSGFYIPENYIKQAKDVSCHANFHTNFRLFFYWLQPLLVIHVWQSSYHIKTVNGNQYNSLFKKKAQWQH